ncbi:glycosyltransferase [Butyrivibrio sp. NC3005]|uniref:glycosyltransferase n=1 Tax=Butyrivibrio sp. NC3005 TaxID=1280685 RepID=UPI0004221028|nr:glycosyltransferase [Butyrivibrio sp. NC3005]
MNETTTYPIISVIIPAYNIEKLLPRCVDSVLAQTYPKDRLEILIVDDGSSDNTGKIADDYAKRYSNIVSLHEENAGSSAARNYALSKVRGEYIGFVDSDDYIEPDMYENLMIGILNNNVKMAQIGRDEIAEDGTKLPCVVPLPRWETIYSPKGFMKLLLLHEGDSSFCTKLTHRSFFEKKEFPVGKLNEDFDLLYHLLPEIGEIVFVNKIGYHVFYRTGSNSRKKVEEKDYFPPVFTDIVVNSDECYEFVNKNFPQLERYAIRFCLVQRLDYLLHIPISKMTKDNKFYQNVCVFVRKHKKDALNSPFLGKRQKLYLWLFAGNPRLIRQVHAKLRGIK